MRIITIEEHYVSEAINHQYNQLMNQTATEEEKIISGHWDETTPYFLDRLNVTLPQAVTGLNHDIAYYYRHNIYVTLSGMFYKIPMSLYINELGEDRVLWSMDYPYMLRENTATFLENFDISDEEKAQIAYKNAEALFKL